MATLYLYSYHSLESAAFSNRGFHTELNKIVIEASSDSAFIMEWDGA